MHLVRPRPTLQSSSRPPSPPQAIAPAGRPPLFRPLPLLLPTTFLLSHRPLGTPPMMYQRPRNILYPVGHLGATETPILLPLRTWPRLTKLAQMIIHLPITFTLHLPCRYTYRTPLRRFLTRVRVPVRQEWPRYQTGTRMAPPML